MICSKAEPCFTQFPVDLCKVSSLKRRKYTAVRPLDVILVLLSLLLYRLFHSIVLHLSASNMAASDTEIRDTAGNVCVNHKVKEATVFCDIVDSCCARTSAEKWNTCYFYCVAETRATRSYHNSTVVTTADQVRLQNTAHYTAPWYSPTSPNVLKCNMCFVFPHCWCGNLAVDALILL